MNKRWLLLSVILILGWAMLRLPQRVFFMPAATEALQALAPMVTEHFTCLRGVRFGNMIIVWSTIRGRSEAQTRWGKWFITEVTCPRGWNTVGSAHNHPEGQRCWFRFPGTVVETSDEMSFRVSNND